MNLPIVTIVGRPNVGKSTLFNRLAGRRVAIVDETPGVTRDRNEIEVEWAGREFILVDTGGLIPEDDDSLHSLVRMQVVYAVEKADLILFLVDGAELLTSADQHITDLLRRSNKNVLLIANKIDRASAKENKFEPMSLGLGEPFAISAREGINVGDLLDLIMGFLPEKTGHTEECTSIKVAIVGKPNVGKSSILNRIVGDSRAIISEIPGTTRDTIDSEIKYKGRSIIFIDTAGIRKKTKIKDQIEFYSYDRAVKAIHRCDIALLIIDSEVGLDKKDFKFANSIVKKGKGLIFVVNKWDLVSHADVDVNLFKKDVREFAPNLGFVPIIFTSAKTGKRIHNILELVTEVNGELHKRIPTGVVNTVMQEAVKRSHPPSLKGKVVRILYASQVKTAPPVFAVFSNAPSLVADNYVKFLLSSLRKAFTFTGVPINIVLRKAS